MPSLATMGRREGPEGRDAPSGRWDCCYFFDPAVGLAITVPLVDGAEAFVFTFGALGFFASRLPRLFSEAIGLSR